MNSDPFPKIAKSKLIEDSDSKANSRTALVIAAIVAVTAGAKAFQKLTETTSQTTVSQVAPASTEPPAVTPSFAPSFSVERRMGNIKPYRDRMLRRMAENLQTIAFTAKALITIDHEGHLLDAEIVDSSGNKVLDKRLLKAIEQTQFEALPNWYKGTELQFKIDTRKIFDLKANQARLNSRK